MLNITLRHKESGKLVDLVGIKQVRTDTTPVGDIIVIFTTTGGMAQTFELKYWDFYVIA